MDNLSPEEELPHLTNEIGIFRGGPNFLANFRYQGEFSLPPPLL